MHALYKAGAVVWNRRCPISEAAHVHEQSMVAYSCISQEQMWLANNATGLPRIIPRVHCDLLG